MRKLVLQRVLHIFGSVDPGVTTTHADRSRAVIAVPQPAWSVVEFECPSRWSVLRQQLVGKLYDGLLSHRAWSAPAIISNAQEAAGPPAAG